jgi:hypothetical protein
MAAVSLDRSPVFAGLADSECAAASSILAHCPPVLIEAGTHVESAVFRDAAVLAVESGLLVVRADIPARARGVIVCHAGTGAVILPPAPGETLGALEKALVRIVSGAARDRLLEIPSAGRTLNAALADTLRQKTRTIVILSSFHHVDRLRGKLQQLAADFGRVGRDGIRLDLPLTHDLLAEMIGSARETVTRAVVELQHEGFLVRNGREYTLRLDAADVGQSV